MKLLTKAIETKLLKNSNLAESAASGGIEIDSDFKPVVKFFNPVGAATWLISEMDPTGRMFGLCDLGFGSPELGYVDLNELSTVSVGLGLGIERDLSFEADKTIGEYATEARDFGFIKA